MSIRLHYSSDPSWSRNPNPHTQECSASNTIYHPNLFSSLAYIRDCNVGCGCLISKAMSSMFCVRGWGGLEVVWGMVKSFSTIMYSVPICIQIIRLIPHPANSLWPGFAEEIKAVGCSWAISNPVEWMRSDRGIKAHRALLQILNT